MLKVHDLHCDIYLVIRSLAQPDFNHKFVALRIFCVSALREFPMRIDILHRPASSHCCTLAGRYTTYVLFVFARGLKS